MPRPRTPGALRTFADALTPLPDPRGGAHVLPVLPGTWPLLLVSALCGRGLTLARESCAAKGNEITAIPRLLNRLVLKGSVGTIDAAGHRAGLAGRGADHVLAVKRNQRTLHAKARGLRRHRTGCFHIGGAGGP